MLHLPCKIILANPDLTPVSLVLRLPREIYLRRSSSNVQRMPAFLKLLQNPHILLTFGRCKIPCACHAKPYLNFKKWSETLRHVLRATTACNFSRMLGAGGLGVKGVLPNCSQPSATVRTCPCEGRMAVPMASSATGVTFGGFERRVACFAWQAWHFVALRDIQTCFVTCRKSFCVAGAILLRCFQKMRCSFRGRRNTLDVSIVILRGRRSTLDVRCCVFFANRIVRAASSGDNVQIPWQAWHFVRHAENLTDASHETSLLM